MERQKQPKTPEQLSEAELAELLEIASAPCDHTGKPAVDGYLTAMHERGSVRNIDYMPPLHIGHYRGLAQMMPQLYPNTSPEDLDVIAVADAAAFGELASYTFEPRYALAELDWQLLEPYLFGAERPPRLIWHGREQSPAFIARQQLGAPRQVQLLAATEATLNIRSGEALQQVIERFGLSDQEFLTCCQLALLAHNSTNALASAALQDARLLERLLQIPDMLASVQHAAREAFMSEAAWSNCTSQYSPELLNELLPGEMRSTLVANSIKERPRIPAEYMLSYTSKEEIIGSVFRKILELLAAPSGKERYWNKSDVAEHYGLDSTPWRLAEMERRHGLVSTFIAAADMWPSGDTVSEYPATCRRLIDTIDPQLDALLGDYASAHNGIRPWPIEGWSGAPEERAIVDEMLAEQAADNQQFYVAKAALENYLAAVAPGK